MCLTAELEPIDESVQRKRKVDQTLARFSAVHDQIAEEERKRRDRRSRFLPWLAADEEMEKALAPTSLTAATNGQPPGAGPTGADPARAGGSEPPEQSAATRLQMKKQRKHHRANLAGKVAVAILAGIVFGASGAAWGAKAWLNGKLHVVDALDQHSSAIRNAAAQADDENFLLVGSDTRIGATADDNAGSAAGVHGARSDTIMVAHIPADRKRVVVVSFPRDLEVTRPQCHRWNPKSGKYSGEVVPPAQHVKLNSVYAIGGPKCETAMIQKLTGLKINHFAGIDFGGFKDMVDAVGGVQVCSPTPLRDRILGVVLRKAGRQVISGTTALDYVRARHVYGDPTSDYGRIQRQQRFLSALLRKVLSQQVLLNPGKLKRFITAFAKSTFGQNIGVDELLTLAQSVQGISSGKVTFVTVPTTGYANDRGNEVLRPAANRQLFDAVINNTPLPGQKPAKKADPAPQASPHPDKPDPHDITIQVLNAGNPTTGIAGRAATELHKRGFHVMPARNAEHSVPHTTIEYGPGMRDKAELVADAAPEAEMQELDTAKDAVLLLVGPDFDGLAPPPEEGSDSDAFPGRPLATVNAADTSCKS